MSYILLVEDNKLVSKCTSLLLQREHFDVKTAVNGMEALELINTRHPDIIICDVQMPVMDGYVFVKKLKSQKRRKDIPVIMHTSIADPKEQQRFHKLGITWYLTKSCHWQELLNAIGNCQSRIKSGQSEFILKRSVSMTDRE